MQNTTRGYPYPEMTDQPPDIPTALGNLANAINADMDKIGKIITPEEMTVFENRLINLESRANSMEQTYNSMLGRLDSIIEKPPYAKIAGEWIPKITHDKTSASNSLFTVTWKNPNFQTNAVYEVVVNSTYPMVGYLGENKYVNVLDGYPRRLSLGTIYEPSNGIYIIYAIPAV